MKSFDNCSNQLNFPMCHGKTICRYCSEFKPKDKPVENKAIFESKKDVIKMFNSIGYTISPENLNALERHGYIRKSDLEILIEEAETMYIRFRNTGDCDGISVMSKLLYNCIQAMKAELNKRRE